jgi:hypothetical protein
VYRRSSISLTSPYALTVEGILDERSITLVNLHRSIHLLREAMYSGTSYLGSPYPELPGERVDDARNPPTMPWAGRGDVLACIAYEAETVGERPFEIRLETNT